MRFKLHQYPSSNNIPEAWIVIFDDQRMFTARAASNTITSREMKA
jgi:hypothetical protein